MSRRVYFWQRFLWIAGLLLGLAGCISPRPSPSPAPTPLPPSPPPPAARIHARAGIDEPLPPPPAPETTSFIVETLPVSPAELPQKERRFYFAPDTGLPVYEVKSFAIPERNIPEKPYYLVLPEETRRALVPGNPNASEEEVLSAFRNVDNEWVVLTVRAINGLFSGAYANRVRDNALLIPTFDKDGRRILMVMQPDDGCNDLAERCDLSQRDIYTNRVQIFWFEDGDVRRAVVGFPQMHHWYNDELGPVPNPIRYNPKDGKIYQLSVDRRFLEFLLFQDEEGKWRWKILPELTPYLVDERGVEDKRQEAVVEMEALGQATGFFGQGVWEKVEIPTDKKLGVDTVVYRVHEGEDPTNPDDVGYLVVQAKKGGEDFYFLIITKSQQTGPGATPAAITTEKGQKNLVEAYHRLVAYLPSPLLQIVYQYGNVAGLFIESDTYEQRRKELGYDFPRENSGSTGWGSLVLFRHFPETPQDDFLTRPIEDDLMKRVVIEAIENRGISHFANLGKTVEDERDLRNITQNEYEMFWATVDQEKPPEERRPIMPVVMPPEEAFKIWVYKNSMVNAFAQFLAFLMGTKGDGVYFPRQLLWKILWESALGDFYFYGINEGLGFEPVPFSPAVP
jgi:hypothetical protein